MHVKSKLFQRFTAAVLSLAASAHMQAALAQTPDAVRSFEAAYFTQFAPRTALDMVQRVPGFSVSGGNDNGRGLGQGSGNVLINGARISGKSASPRDTLSRIAAGSVIRLEILDGATLSIPGLSGEVINVTTRPDEFSGSWEWQPEFREKQSPNLLNGQISASGQKGRLTYTASLEVDGERRGSDGLEIDRTAEGEIFEIADERGRTAGETPEASLSLTYDYSEDIAANFNLVYSRESEKERERSDRGALQSPGVTETLLFDESVVETEGEISADITFPAAGGRVKLIGLYGFGEEDEAGRVRGFRAGDLDQRTEFFGKAETGERILRGEYSRTLRGHEWQIAGETAFNFVDLSSRLFELENGEFAQTDLDDPNVRVEEDRAEITLTHSRALTPKLDFQGSLGVEKSTLTQSGNAANSREFIRPKGFANFSYQVNDTLIGRLKIDRIVGQLDFFDFISDVDIEDDNSTDSNSDLVPVQFWNFAAEIDKTFAGGDTVLLRVFYEDIEDLVAQIPVGTDGDAVGNIDAASSYGACFNSTVMGERFGIAGAQLDLDFFFQETDVTDPVTGRAERIVNRQNRIIDIDYRHDIPGTDWAYGLGIYREYEEPNRDTDDISIRYYTGPFTYLYAEHKDFYGMTAGLSVRNVLGNREVVRRTVYYGRRDSGIVDFSRRREREYGRIIRLTLSGSF